MGGFEMSVRPSNWAPSAPALPHARKPKKRVLEWPLRSGTKSSRHLSSSVEYSANLIPGARGRTGASPNHLERFDQITATHFIELASRRRASDLSISECIDPKLSPPPGSAAGQLAGAHP